MTHSPQGSSSKVVLWIVLGIVALILIGGAACGALVCTYGKDIMKAANKVEDAATVAQALVYAMDAHVKTSGDFPNSLDELSGSMDAETFARAKEMFKYTKPAKDAPDTTVILTSENWEMIMGVTQAIEVDKALRAVMVQRSPLDDGRSMRPQVKTD